MTAPVITALSSGTDAATIAEWIWMEWARHEPDASRADSDAVVHAALQGAPIPHFLVARVAERPVGCASIVAADLPTRPDLGPWLANVYVHPGWRGRGVGTALARRAMAHGARCADRLYLYTSGGTAMYERLGWQAFDDGCYAGRPIVILRYKVDPHGLPRRT